MDKVYSYYVYLSAYLKVMIVHATGRPNGHDNNLFDIKGPSYDLIMRFVCVGSKVSLREVEADNSFSVLSIKVFKF